MNKINNKSKVEQLKKDIFYYNNTFQYHYLIIKLLNNGNIDNLINKISDTKVKINITTLTKKDYLSANEQFLSLLSNFIYTFKESFYFLNNNFDCIVELLLQNEKYTKYLLCKKYIGDNKNIAYFSYHIKRLIVCGFYSNIKKLSNKSDIIKQFIKDNNLNLRKNLIDYPKELDKLYNTLLNISICNAKTLSNILLYEDINHYIKTATKKYNNKPNTSIYNYYVREWEIMIKNYYEKIDATKIIFK